MLRQLLEMPYWKVVLFATIAIGTVGILANYPDYLPPNFHAVFLLGRQGYFFGIYQWAFYAHLIAGPVTLVLGTLLMSETLRSRWPKGHRTMGQVQVAAVLLLLCPSGLVMSYWAMSGVIAAVGLATLAMLTAVSILLGWRAAVAGRMDAHRRWMLRTFALLASSIVLRLIAGTTEWLQLQGNYPLSVWVSWIAPLVVVELYLRSRRRAPQVARTSLAK
ncbi:DUF2306 domain-containing protein [Aeoliella mucimassa]|uniref:DUF2306 domain-containing protein n=1 Tax=Aeoliella mucimassa TaxID=2527972 RepID=A0A518ASZ6_9BACT|nr:DUF2306 domain-containing protein [Aeoliella mucimassa]QDU57807.1 hypothetical protein Pan181_40300 [Aeoliella mucimassa]